MIKKLNSTTELISKLGKSYKFKLYSFDDFDDLKGFFDEDPAIMYPIIETANILN